MKTIDDLMQYLKENVPHATKCRCEYLRTSEPNCLILLTTDITRSADDHAMFYTYTSSDILDGVDDDTFLALASAFARGFSDSVDLELSHNPILQNMA